MSKDSFRKMHKFLASKELLLLLLVYNVEMIHIVISSGTESNCDNCLFKTQSL
jgi:hypothetical protein